MDKDFVAMMKEIESFKETELSMNQNANSFIDSCNLLLYQYQCLCYLERKYQSDICILFISTFYDKQKILNEIKIILALIHLSGEKSHWHLKNDISDLGLVFIACI